MDINQIVRQAVEEVLSQLGSSAPCAPAAAAVGDDLAPTSMAKYIDHTLLKPEASIEQIKKVCDEAKQYHFASVCVNTTNVAFVAEQLRGSGVNQMCIRDSCARSADCEGSAGGTSL